MIVVSQLTPVPFTDFSENVTLPTSAGGDGSRFFSDRRIGVAFADRVDVAALLASLREVCDGWKPRMPRLATDCLATLEIDEESGTVGLLDLSQGGAKIDGVRLVPGEAVTLTIPAMDPRRGVVRWAKDGQAGIGFMRAIPFDVLARWTIDYRDSIVHEAAAA